MNYAANNQTTTPEPFVLQRRIGSTLYRVRARFSETNKETLDDKILRLLNNDLNLPSSYATINMLQTGWLPERSSS